MAQRNMLSTSRITDIEMDRHSHSFPDPCMVTTFPHSNTHSLATVSFNSPYLNGHNYDASISYVMPQYHSVSFHPHHHVLNPYMAMTPASNFYVPYVAPCSGAPVSFGVCDQLFPPTNHGAMGVTPDESHKRKNVEVHPFQSFNASTTSSSSASLNIWPDGVAVTDSMSYGPPYYGVNYMGHPRYPVGSPWFNQQLTNSSVAVPHMIGNNVNGGYVEVRRMGSDHYCDPASNQTYTTFLLAPSFNPQHLLPLPIQGMGAHNIVVLPQAPPTALPGHPTSYASQSFMNPPQDGLDAGRRHLGSVQTTGLSIYRHHQEGITSDTTLGHHNLPRLRVLPTDGVALLEFPDYYETEYHIDEHRDMRLDIEDMSYEDLLALGEWIGNVNTGASDEIIRTKLKTRRYLSTQQIDLEAAPCTNQESDSCIICQDEYENEEKIATLECGHEYHADCLKKWVCLKNVCPICKCKALSIGEDEV